MKNAPYLASLRVATVHVATVTDMGARAKTGKIPPRLKSTFFLKFQKINFGECIAIKTTWRLGFWDPWHKQKFGNIITFENIK